MTRLLYRVLRNVALARGVRQGLRRRRPLTLADFNAVLARSWLLEWDQQAAEAEDTERRDIARQMFAPQVIIPGATDER